MKGWPTTAGKSIISKDKFDPGAFGKLGVWLDASDANHFSTGSGIPSDGDVFVKWYDLSGNNHHASIASGTPTWETSYLNSMPGTDLNGARLTLDGSETGMDGWSQLHAFAVFQFNSNTTWQYSFGKTTNVNGASQTAWHFGLRRGDNDPPLVRSWVVNTAGTASGLEDRGTSASVKNNLGLLVISYDGTNFTVRIDGTQWGTRTASGTLQSLPTTPVSLNQGHDMKFGEFVVYSQALSSADEQEMEGYLAHKWGLDGDLPASGHSYKSAPPSAGWGIQRASTGNDSLTLNTVGAGGEFSKEVPVNDNQWHHLVTTYGGGNKKIYVDGLEVATAAQSGSVTASNNKLSLGDVIPFGDPNRPQIDDVRIYGVALTAAEVAAIYNEGENDVGAQKFSVTSPSTIQGAVGKSVSYQITTDAAYGMTGYNSAITYTLLNKPSWLSVNGSTGAVSGTPPSAGTYSFQAKATNTLGTGIKDVTITVSDYANWNYALPFTTDYAGGSALQDWNMLVRLSEDSSNGAGNAGFRYSQLSPNGGDLRFVSKAGEELKYEIANWNTAGESQVWVRVPSLASDENVTMYWGNTNAGLPAYANNGSVWDGYFGVYHLEGTTGSAVDSSPMSNNLPGVNAPVLEASGLSGTAYSSTSAANNGFISSALSGNIKAKNGTYSLWINHSPNVANKHFFGMEYNNDASNYLYVVGGTASANKARVWVAGGSTGFTGISTPTTTLSGGWQMLTLVINNGYAQVYVDGTADGSSAWYHPGLDAVSGLAIGRGTADAGRMPPLTRPPSPPHHARPIGYLPVTITKSPAPPT